MRVSESERLAALSNAVRESTLKRLRRVKSGRENWRPLAGAMSFAEMAGHLIDADKWLFEKLRDESIMSMQGAADASRIVSPDEYLALLKQLRRTGTDREKLIRELSDSQFAKVVPDDRFEDPVTVWWVIVRGNLDHEIHHRGQLATYLRIVS